MAGENCPDCGTKRVGSLRFCRTCRYDFDHRVGRFEHAGPGDAVPENAGPGGDTESGATWSVVPQRPSVAEWSYQPPSEPPVPAKGLLIRALEWILMAAILVAAVIAVAVVVNPGLLR